MTDYETACTRLIVMEAPIEGAQFVPGTRAYSAHNRLHVNAPAPRRFAQSYIIGSSRVGGSSGTRARFLVRRSPVTSDLRMFGHVTIPGPLRAIGLSDQRLQRSPFQSCLKTPESRLRSVIPASRLAETFANLRLL